MDRYKSFVGSSLHSKHKLAELFILYGANVKKRPYVARYMDRNVIADKNPRKKLLDFYKDKNGIINLPSESEIYSACEILLKAGADPNMMGGEEMTMYY